MVWPSRQGHQSSGISEFAFQSGLDTGFAKRMGLPWSFSQVVAECSDLREIYGPYNSKTCEHFLNKLLKCFETM